MVLFSIDNVPVKVCFEALNCKTLRVAVLPVEESVKDVFSTIDLDEDLTWNEPGLEVRGSDGETTYYIDYAIDEKECGGFTVVVNGDDFSIKVLHDERHIQTLTVCKESGAVSFPTGKGHLFGLGHGYKNHIDRRGGIYDLQINGQVIGIMETFSATSPTPLVISTAPIPIAKMILVADIERIFLKLLSDRNEGSLMVMIKTRATNTK